MSRCFPYPPPGHTLSRARNEALIESIKLLNEREKQKAKEQRKKEKRREKKEKRKERKEMKDRTDQNPDKSDIVKVRIGEKNCLGKTRREAEIEQSESSSLTEDHGQPVGLPLPCSSSDSTGSSNKRLRPSLPVDGNNHGHEKQKEVSGLAKEQELGSTSFQTDYPAQNKYDVRTSDRPDQAFCKLKETSNTGQSFTLRTNRELIHLIAVENEAVAPFQSGIKSVPKAVETSTERTQVQCKNLLESWVPPQLQDAFLYSDDIDWLFNSKNQDIRAEKRQRSGNDYTLCSRSSALWPRAEYLHEIDAYALPFAVPY